MLDPEKRRQGREIALQVLFQREFQSPLDYSALIELLEANVEAQVMTWAQSLIDGVISHQAALDEKLQSASQKWKLQRMSLIDRNILRVAVFEMLFAAQPSKPQIAINEAVEIAKKFGTTDSGAFVNGILDQIKKDSGLNPA